MDDKKLFLLDAYALIYRAYYALIRSPRVTSKGFNTSAVFGFCTTLDEILRKENPGFMAVCFDPAGGKTFRHEVYADYKAKRDKQPEDITLAVPYIKRILEAYRIPVIEVEGYEADDVIGTLAREAADEGFDTYMMTPDKDYGQLVGPHTYMYRPSTKGQGFEIRGVREICERYGISSPQQVIDLLALEGDVADNVPGCPGVGEKTAAKLIGEYGTIENLLANADKIKGALGKRIAENSEQIRFSKFLVTIKTDVPLEMSPDSLVRQEPDVAALEKIFNELEFKTLTARLLDRFRQPSAAASAKKDNDAADRPAMGSLFDLADDSSAPDEPVLQTVETDFVTLTDDKEIADTLQSMLGAATIGMSLFAVGEEAMTAPLLGIALSPDDKSTFYIEFPATTGERKVLTTLLSPLFASESITFVSHDVKRDMILLRRENIEFTAKFFDTSVAHYLLAPETNHRLSTVAQSYLGLRTADFDIDATKLRKLYSSDPELARRVAIESASVVRKLMRPLADEIDAQGQRSLLDDIEFPMVTVLASMEWEGVRIDVSELAKLSRRLTERLHRLETQCYEMAGTTFNISSPSQVGEILFGRLAIDESARKTKRGQWSTTEEVLEKYRSRHPIVGLILEIRGLKKLLVTYIDALPKLVNPLTGKIHTTYNQTVTATGRLSSTNPNLQNIPIRTDDGREIRRAFIPDRGSLMMSADYSQIELRLMADISGDPTMIEAFGEHEDIHRSTAAKIYHTDIDKVSDNQRRNAKTANFGIIYGISSFGLSERLGISRAEARELIDGYMTTYPRIKEYIDEAVEEARQKGYVTTIMGRKRYLPDINSRSAVVRGYAERNAVNAPLQGSAADIIKMAMIAIHREIKRRGLKSRMILQVHDELVFTVVPEELEQLKELTVRLMSEAYKARVPLEVSVGVGDNWLEAH